MLQSLPWTFHNLSNIVLYFGLTVHSSLLHVLGPVNIDSFILGCCLINLVHVFKSILGQAFAYNDIPALYRIYQPYFLCRNQIRSEPFKVREFSNILGHVHFPLLQHHKFSFFRLPTSLGKNFSWNTLANSSQVISLGSQSPNFFSQALFYHA